jgi:predicted outer membrane protein
MTADRSISRRTRGFLALLATLGVLVGAPAVALAYDAHDGHGDAAAGSGGTSSAALSPTDRELLVRVRLAGLWEAPSGRLAQDHAQSPQVKEVGAHLEHDHLALDDQVRSLAARLGVALPDVPSVEQQGWLAELTGKWGADFDVAFANLLRAAHGRVFSFAAAVRAGTRNEAIRDFAQTAVNVVMKHMTLLEGTGLVDYAALPEAALPPISPAERLARSFGNGRGAPLVWTVLVAAIVAGTAAAARVVRPR